MGARERLTLASRSINRNGGVNTMAGKTSRKSAKVAKKAAAKRVAAKAAKPRKTAPKSQSRKVAKPVLLHQVRQSGFLPRHVTASSSPRRVQAQGALPRHPRGRPARRRAGGELDSAGIGAARLGPVAPGSADRGAAYDDIDRPQQETSSSRARRRQPIETNLPTVSFPRAQRVEIQSPRRIEFRGSCFGRARIRGYWQTTIRR